jgi:hypothetical protein
MSDDWRKKDVPMAVRMEMHATDPANLELRLGHWDSEGCIRIPSRFNSFLDQHGLIDAKLQEAAQTDRRFAALLPKGIRPSPLAGSVLVVVDSSDPNAIPSDPVKANAMEHPNVLGPEHDDAGWFRCIFDIVLDEILYPNIERPGDAGHHADGTMLQSSIDLGDDMLGFTYVRRQIGEGFPGTAAPERERRWWSQVSVHIGLAERRRSSRDVMHGGSMVACVEQVLVLGPVENNAIVTILGDDLHVLLRHS